MNVRDATLDSTRNVTYAATRAATSALIDPPAFGTTYTATRDSIYIATSAATWDATDAALQRIIDLWKEEQ